MERRYFFFVGYITVLSVSRLFIYIYILDDRMINECGAVGGMRIGRGIEVLGEHLTSATLPVTNPT
jgi:hypothetical protein